MVAHIPRCVRQPSPSPPERPMRFSPDDAPVPAELRTAEFLLRPLRAADAELD